MTNVDIAFFPFKHSFSFSILCVHRGKKMKSVCYLSAGNNKICVDKTENR